MFKRVMLMALVASFVILGSKWSQAALTITGYSSNYSTYELAGFNGGEFTMTPNLELWNHLGGYKDGVTSNVKGYAGTFQTFCLEYNEHFNPGTTYQVTLNSKAMNGGKTSGDELSVGTAYLYRQFVRGTLTGYHYSNESLREQDAKQLQLAIWSLEEEGGYQNTVNETNNVFLQLLIDNIWTDGTDISFLSEARVDSNGKYGIMAMNLGNPGQAQDMLVATPIPAAVWLLASGLIGIVAVRRRSLN